MSDELRCEETTQDQKDADLEGRSLSNDDLEAIVGGGSTSTKQRKKRKSIELPEI